MWLQGTELGPVRRSHIMAQQTLLYTVTGTPSPPTPSCPLSEHFHLSDMPRESSCTSGVGGSSDSREPQPALRGLEGLVSDASLVLQFPAFLQRDPPGPWLSPPSIPDGFGSIPVISSLMAQPGPGNCPQTYQSHPCPVWGRTAFLYWMGGWVRRSPCTLNCVCGFVIYSFLVE